MSELRLIEVDKHEAVKIGDQHKNSDIKVVKLKFNTETFPHAAVRVRETPFKSGWPACGRIDTSRK